MPKAKLTIEEAFRRGDVIDEAARRAVADALLEKKIRAAVMVAQRQAQRGKRAKAGKKSRPRA